VSTKDGCDALLAVNMRRVDVRIRIEAGTARVRRHLALARTSACRRRKTLGPVGDFAADTARLDLPSPNRKPMKPPPHIRGSAIGDTQRGSGCCVWSAYHDGFRPGSLRSLPHMSTAPRHDAPAEPRKKDSFEHRLTLYCFVGDQRPLKAPCMHQVKSKPHRFGSRQRLSIHHIANLARVLSGSFIQ